MDPDSRSLKQVLQQSVHVGRHVATDRAARRCVCMQEPDLRTGAVDTSVSHHSRPMQLDAKVAPEKNEGTYMHTKL